MDTWQGAIAEHIVAQQLQVLLDEQYISDLHFGYVTNKAPMPKQILYGKGNTNYSDRGEMRKERASPFVTFFHGFVWR